MEDGCWNYDKTDANTCNAKSGCTWSSWTSTGWCEELNCWSWDGMKGGTQTSCEANSTAYNLNCMWSSNGQGANDGWCSKDFSTTTCSNITTERACMDTMYCWWQYTNYNDVSSGGACQNPSWGAGTVTSTGGVTNEWNPGCYIFDNNQTECNGVFGCEYSENECLEVTAAGAFLEYGTNITANGIKCEYINDSSMCANIAALSSCCGWQNGICSENRMSATCKSSIDSSIGGGAVSCEDATSQTSCEELAASPLYWPCNWDNVTIPAKCAFNADKVWGNRTQNLITIENEKTCEAAGGKWVTENYCEGNISVPAGRCEYKFDEETNCNKACFACEYKSDGSNHNTSAEAESACLGSTLGFCEFETNSTAPNSYGWCKAKSQFKSGVSEGCSATNCGGCTFMGDPIAVLQQTNGTKSPKEYCEQYSTSCKWLTDNTTITNGYCADIETKICEDACDRCTTQDKCSNNGRTSLTAGTSGSCKWQDGTSTCVANTGEDVEVCWNGEDDNSNTLIDCADPSCFSDSFCGFVGGGCSIHTNNDTCNDASCEWITDKWGSWCDAKGTQCWKYDKNSTVCSDNANCKWESGTGGSWCERDWSIAEICAGLSTGACDANSSNGCVWTNDTWCSGLGATSDWCLTSGGGWCEHSDFKPKNCWQYSGLADCSATSGCSWQTDEWSKPMCEVDWSGNCWQNIDSSTCSANGCAWRNDSWGAWCDNKMNYCYGLSAQSTCESETSVSCTWQTWMGGSGGNCQPSCFNSTVNNDAAGCSALDGCNWKADSGWCQESAMQDCYNMSITHLESCTNVTGCRWKNSGWCSPATGFTAAATTSGGMGSASGGQGGDCWKYDGNPTLCTNQSAINISCGWSTNQNPFCEVDWSTNCWQHTEAAQCEAGNCWWNPGMGGDSSGWCTNMMDQCWSNSTFQSWSNPDGWSGNCSNSIMCQVNSWGSCEPACMSGTEATCGGLTGCRWNAGWCNPAGMSQMFDQMETGAPVPLGKDDPLDTSQASVDLLGFGMKDMGDAYGFGAFVLNFENASTCNKEKINSHVFEFASGMGGSGIGGGSGGPGPSEVEAQEGGLPGTGGGGSFSDKTGTGNDTIKYLVYIDSDGSTIGNCILDYNSTADGYEFKLVYESVWNATNDQAKETLTSYKCDSNTWKITDVKINAWKKNMCGEIGGPMIAVDKGELSKYPTLYDSTKDLRIAVSTIGNDGTGNATSPSDSAGPGWATPGTIDFEIKSAFEFGANSAKFEEILSKGYVQYEDCFNGIDDNNDGQTDCFDWDCQYSSKCDGLGVNAADYVDTQTPQVIGVKIEEYPDSALVMYDTNKPSNGTLQFYGNDSTCNSLNATVYDAGMLNANMRTFKLWHTGEIYIDNLGYDLATDLTYYYKLQVCDDNGKCALSKCTSFMTSSTTKCGFCNYVARIKAPTGWTVSYDVNQDGTYEHVQGAVCGPNAGMKLNYTAGRNVNIKMENSDASSKFEFINSSLTKTGLNDKVRTISDAGSIIKSSTIVGLNSDTRDKIINNLHPEACLVKIPVSGACTVLYHCDDSGENCVDRTSSATLVDSTNCIWQIPYCEFSTYKTNAATTTTTTSSSGGGGGGGSASAPASNATITGASYTKGISTIEAGASGTFDFTTNFGITSIETKVKTKVFSQTIKVTDKTIAPGVELSAGSAKGEKVHKYIEITPSNALSLGLEKMKVKFKLAKTELAGYDPAKVVLKKYKTSWDVLPTTKTSEDTNNYYYEGESDSFSLYAIVLTENCKKDWSCTEWSACTADGKQVKTCTDKNSCGTTEQKPAETQSCIYTPPVEAKTQAQEQQMRPASETKAALALPDSDTSALEPATSSAQKQTKKQTNDLWIKLVLAAIAIIVIVVLVKGMKKHK